MIYKTKEQKNHENIYTKQIFPEQKTKKSFALHHRGPIHEVSTGIWKPLISAQIVNSFGQGECTFDCQSAAHHQKMFSKFLVAVSTEALYLSFMS